MFFQIWFIYRLVASVLGHFGLVIFGWWWHSPKPSQASIQVKNWILDINMACIKLQLVRLHSHNVVWPVPNPHLVSVGAYSLRLWPPRIRRAFGGLKGYWQSWLYRVPHIPVWFGGESARSICFRGQPWGSDVPVYRTTPQLRANQQTVPASVHFITFTFCSFYKLLLTNYFLPTNFKHMFFKFPPSYVRLIITSCGYN